MESKDVARPTLNDLHAAALNFPAIDNHAHALLQTDHRADLPLEGIFSEAEGTGLTQDAIHTLACHRATRQLALLFGLPESSSWEDVKAKRLEMDYNDLCARCFDQTSIHCILVDDGLRIKDSLHDIQWHDRFTLSPSKRVVRVETVAEDILLELFAPLSELTCPDFGTILKVFIKRLADDLTACAKDATVSAFKSVVCYRTGLAVSLEPDRSSSTEPELPSELASGLKRVFNAYEASGKVRLQEKILNDYVVRLVLGISGEWGKPVQFHTGLGDNEITLTLASPANLQPVIKAFPDTKFVLLHSSYPYTRDAAYLTSVYSNVFLDFGEVFPIVANHGLRSIIRQILETAPTNKIMWSTDGHFWPETYYLSTIQARQILYEVLGDIVHNGDLSEVTAVEIVQNALFYNANKVYNLGLKLN